MTSFPNKPISKTAFIHSHSGRIQSLDGWRGLAVILVLFGHLGLGQVQLFGDVSPVLFFLRQNNYALLGVDLFFVISGFIITYLILKEKETTGSFKIRKFYIRRILRIVPVFYAYLLLLVIINQPLELQLSPIHFLKSIFYVNNFQSGGGHQLINHAWSLSVEEQYYLVWPLTLLFLKNIRDVLTLAFFVFIIGMSYRIGFYKFGIPPFYDYILGGFILHTTSIITGAITAFLSFKYNLANLFNRPYYSITLLIISTALIFGFEVADRKGVLGLITLPFKPILQSISIALLIVFSITKRSLLSKLLSWNPLLKIGLWSYSIYIWQQFFLLPTFELYANTWGPLKLLFTFPGNILAVSISAIISYYFIEVPMNRVKSKWGSNIQSNK